MSGEPEGCSGTQTVWPAHVPGRGANSSSMHHRSHLGTDSSLESASHGTASVYWLCRKLWPPLLPQQGIKHEVTSGKFGEAAVVDVILFVQLQLSPSHFPTQ